MSKRYISHGGYVMESDNTVLAQWEELKALVGVLELDVAKNARGIVAAGVRARKGLREIKKRADRLVKTTVELDKLKKA